jgi:hypothetical protein
LPACHTKKQYATTGKHMLPERVALSLSPRFEGVDQSLRRHHCGRRALGKSKHNTTMEQPLPGTIQQPQNPFNNHTISRQRYAPACHHLVAHVAEAHALYNGRSPRLPPADRSTSPSPHEAAASDLEPPPPPPPPPHHPPPPPPPIVVVELEVVQGGTGAGALGGPELGGSPGCLLGPCSSTCRRGRRPVLWNPPIRVGCGHGSA